MTSMKPRANAVTVSAEIVGAVTAPMKDKNKKGEPVRYVKE